MTTTQTSGAGARVIVAGSINIDVVARVTRLPSPGETRAGHDLAYIPGGKGSNQAVAAARAGARVAMTGCVGDDAFGASLRQFLAAEGIDVQHVVSRPGVPTGTALVLVDADGENEIVVIAAANALLDRELVAGAAPRPGDVLVAQFETPIEATVAFFAAGRAAEATNLLNPAPAGPVGEELLTLVDVLVVNETEAGQVLRLLAPDEPASPTVAAALTRWFGLVVVTLGGHGATWAPGGGLSYDVPAFDVPVVDTTGAGDAFCGALAAALAAGAETAAAVERGVAASALAVQHAGASSSVPTRGEVDALLATRS